jgi:hypothetical protein
VSRYNSGSDSGEVSGNTLGYYSGKVTGSGSGKESGIISNKGLGKSPGKNSGKEAGQDKMCKTGRFLCFAINLSWRRRPKGVRAKESRPRRGSKNSV